MQIQNLEYPCDKPLNILVLWIILDFVEILENGFRICTL